MNLYIRLLWILLSSLWKEKMPISALHNTLTLRVLPNDLDLNLHMNNGRFLTICDLNRVDLFVRTGLLKLMLSNKWSPIINLHTMEYKKALGPWQKYQVSMAITHWDERYFYATHTFRVGDHVVAEGHSKALILGKQGVVNPAHVIAMVQQRQG